MYNGTSICNFSYVGNIRRRHCVANRV